MPYMRYFVIVMTGLVLITPVGAASCGPDKLGTARVLTLDASSGAKFGTKQYPSTLPLADKEVVLTFDDGPLAGTTEKVLDALAAECVKATFFLIGRNAATLPALVARTASEGHSIANHTNSHPWTLPKLSFDDAMADIDKGAESITTALGTSGKLAPFVRYPGFEGTDAIDAALAKRQIAIFGADFWASDWNQMSPEKQLSLVLFRLEKARKGIVLFHDTKQQTAAMIPAFLKALKAKGYKVVHVTGH